MKWGNLKSVSPDLTLLYWVLIWNLRPTNIESIDRILWKSLSVGSGGDLGWEIEPRKTEAERSYWFWGDQEISGLPYSERIYSEKEVKNAAIESLEAFIVQFPEFATQAEEAIRKLTLSSEKRAE